MYKLDEKQFPLEMRFKATERTFNKYPGAYNVAIYETLGDEGIKLISTPSEIRHLLTVIHHIRISLGVIVTLLKRLWDKIAKWTNG